MKIISVINQKGGVGKTTITINFAAGLALHGYKVLVVDMDLQANASIGFGIESRVENNEQCDVFAWLLGLCSAQKATICRVVEKGKKRAQLDIIPATIALSGFDQAVRNVSNKQILLKQQIAALKTEYDYIIVDCPPSLGLASLNALVASDELLIPVQPEFFALQGLSQLLDTVAILNQSSNLKLSIGGVICSRVNRRKIHAEVIDCLEQRFENKLFLARIHENIALAEAPSFGKTIFEYQPLSQGSHDFDLLVREYIKRNNAQMTIPLVKNKMHEVV